VKGCLSVLAKRRCASYCCLLQRWSRRRGSALRSFSFDARLSVYSPPLYILTCVLCCNCYNRRCFFFFFAVVVVLLLFMRVHRVTQLSLPIGAEYVYTDANTSLSAALYPLPPFFLDCHFFVKRRVCALCFFFSRSCFHILFSQCLLRLSFS
jgi:hypothetical protein